MTKLIQDYCPECYMPCDESVIDGVCSVCDTDIAQAFKHPHRQLRREDLQEFVVVARECSVWGKLNGYPAPRDYPQYSRLRELGQRFLDRGGFTEMRQALAILDMEITEEPGLSWSRFIEFAWRDIGGWAP